MTKRAMVLLLRQWNVPAVMTGSVDANVRLYPASLLAEWVRQVEAGTLGGK